MATIRRHYGKWQAQVRRANYPSQTKSFTLKKDAEEWARKIEIQIQQDDCGIQQKDFPTFKETILRYTEEVSIKKKGYQVERYHLQHILKNNWVNKSINQIKPNLIVNYRDERLKTVKSSTVLREFNILQHIFSTAIKEWGYPITNPFHLIRKPNGNFRRERRLSEAEYTFLVKGNYPQTTLRNIIEVAIETAMRRSEILNIKPEHIKGQTLLIPVTKNGHPRTIPLTKRAIYILGNTKLPFPMSANAVRLAWDRLKKKGSIKDLHFHDCRHEAISRFFEKGLSIPEVALISGHKDVRMLFRYTYLKAEDILRKL